MEQLIFLIVGCLIGGIASYYINKHFSSTRSDLRMARDFLKQHKYEESLEHYNRFFLETRNTSLLQKEIERVFYAECDDAFINPIGSPEAAILESFYGNKKADNKIISPIVFSLVALHKELTRCDDLYLWFVEIPTLIINAQKDEALTLLKRLEESNKEIDEIKRIFYFTLVKTRLDSSNSETRNSV